MVTSMVTYKNVVEATVDIIREAETQLPDDVIDALKNARQDESSDVAVSQIDAILKNIDIASNNNIPLCQDTGILIFYVEIGRELKLNIDLKGAILEASRIATQEVPLRPNAVHPITRSNSSDNTGDGIPDIKYDFVEGDQLKITVAPRVQAQRT